MQHFTTRNEKCHLLTTVRPAGGDGSRQEDIFRAAAACVHAALASMIVVTTLVGGIAHGQTLKKSSPIRVTCLDVYGQGERGVGPKNIQRCLGPSPEFTFQTVNADDVRSNALAKFDVIICPGGSGSKQSRLLDAEGRRVIEEFIKNGGGYIGICAGAYLASSQYSWSLGILNAKVVGNEHWARGTGDVTLKMTAEGRRLLGANDEIVTCFYGQGPLLAPGDHTDLPPYQVLATYNSEVVKKNAPSGVMIGTTAIATGTYGKGHVLCFSPHPEKTKGLEDFVCRAVRWAASKDRKAEQAQGSKTPKTGRFQQEILAFEAADRANPPPTNAILFTGDSNVRRWKTQAEDFPRLVVINRGFGGSTIADGVHYADRIVVPCQPRIIVLRAGTNEISVGGKTPEEVADDFKAFAEKVQARLPNTKIVYWSMAPAVKARAIWDRQSKANELIKAYVATGKNMVYIDATKSTLGPDGKPRADLYEADGMHFNAEGFKISAKLLRPYLE